MTLLPALATVLFCSSAWAVGGPALPIEIESPDRNAIQTFIEALGRVDAQYPGLIPASQAAALRFSDDSSEPPNIYYDVQHRKITVNRPREFLEGGSHAAPGYYKSVAWQDAFLFHELLHGLGRASAGLEQRYEREASEGRLHRMWQEWAAEIDAVVVTPYFEATIRLEPRADYAGSDRTVQFVGLGVTRTKTKAQLADEWDRIAARLSEEEARRIVEEHETPEMRQIAQLLGLDVSGLTFEQLGAALAAAAQRDVPAYRRVSNTVLAERMARARPKRERLARAQKQLAAKHGIPRRSDDDAHAGTPNEWFAYGGEVYFYGARPDLYLTPRELEFWRGLEPRLKAPASN